ncbi:MAG: methyltransferase type 11 [Thermoplasmatales archaeon Gpl]|nr:MAG: methyltransferase type 11 [Thermoplasmatales archaeon Gpl]
MHIKTSKEFYTEMGVDWLSARKNTAQTESELSYLTGILRNGSTILDLACGYGRFSIPLAEYGYTVYGMDITPIFIERAREEAKKRSLNIEFKNGNMQNIPYPEDSFDYVICMWNAFSELSNEQEQIEVIHEIYRVLKEKGIAIIEMRNHRSSGIVEKNFIGGFEAMPSFNHTRGSIKRLMRLSGVVNYKIFLDNFGGRKRLILEIVKI